MRNDSLDGLIVLIGCRLWLRQHITRVKDIEALVLHRAHIEIIYRHNLVHIQVILATIDLFIPAHRLFDGGHGVGALPLVLVLHVDMQGYLSPRRGAVGVAHPCQRSRHQGKEIRRLGEGIHPAGIMTPIGEFPHLCRITVGEQHRITHPIRPEGGRERCHDIRTIEVIGDPPKPLCLALGAEVPTRGIEPLKGRVLFGAHLGCHLKGERLRHLMDRQGLWCHQIFIGVQLAPVQGETVESQPLAIQYQGQWLGSGTPQTDARANHGRAVV